MSLPLKWSLVRSSTEVGASLSWKYYTRVEMTDSNKHSSLLHYGINYRCKRFYSAGPKGKSFKHFLVVKLGQNKLS
jgi:hypothetical protein